MPHIKRIIPVAVTLTLFATNVSAAVNTGYNFMPLVVLFIANLIVGGLLALSAFILFKVWRDKRLVHQRATTRQPTKVQRRQQIDQLSRTASQP